MANVVITFKIMPSSPEIDLTTLEEQIKAKIFDFAGEGETKSEQEPIAFGLVALKITFVSDEAKGGTEMLEDSIKDLEGVESCETVDVRRAVG